MTHTALTMPETFRCGHAKSPENIAGYVRGTIPICRACNNARKRITARNAYERKKVFTPWIAKLYEEAR